MVENGRVKKDLKTLKQDKCTTCRWKAGNVRASKQANKIQEPTKSKTGKLFHNTNRKTVYVIYLMEYTIYNLQDVNKYKAPFKIRSNNHRKDVKKHQSDISR